MRIGDAEAIQPGSLSDADLGQIASRRGCDYPRGGEAIIMLVILDVLLILHFIGLMLGAGGGWAARWRWQLR